MLRFPTILLTGPPGVGKTTISKFLAKDNDFVIFEFSKENHIFTKVLRESIMRVPIIVGHPSTETRNGFTLHLPTNGQLFVMSPMEVIFLYCKETELMNRILSDQNKRRELITWTKRNGDSSIVESNLLLRELITAHISLTAKYPVNNILFLNNEDLDETVTTIINHLSLIQKKFDPFYFVRYLYARWLDENLCGNIKQKQG